ncbi:MAG TPA: MMPL family transporter [Verrucomicrobiae bacterium]|jgi:predicted RND superfamily exporter protein
MSLHQLVISAFDALTRYSIHHPRRIVLLAVLFTLGIAPGLMRLKLRTDGHALVDRNAPEVRYDQSIRDQFGVQDQIVVLIRANHPDGIFNPVTLNLVGELTTEFQLINGVRAANVISLATEHGFRTRPGTLIFQTFLETPRQTPQQLEELRDDLRRIELYTGTIVSYDYKSTAILIGAPPGLDRTKLYQTILDVIAAKGKLPDDLAVTGAPVAEALLGIHILEDLGVPRAWLGTSTRAPTETSRWKWPSSFYELRLLIARRIGLVPVAMALMALIFFLSFRTLAATFLPMLEVGASLIFIFGFMGYTHVPVYLTIAVVPVLLTAMAVTDEIHIFSRYFASLRERPEANHIELVRTTMEEMCCPVVNTSLTTAIGFVSFAFSPLRPVQAFGIFTGIGVMFCLVWSLSVMPALLVLIDPKWFRPAAWRRAYVLGAQTALPAHELHPLTPSLSPTGGEGARRAGEGAAPVVQGRSARRKSGHSLPVKNQRGEGQPTADTPANLQARRPSSPQPSPLSEGGEGADTDSLKAYRRAPSPAGAESSLFGSLGTWVVRYRYLVLVVTAVMIALTPFGLRRLVIQDSWIDGFDPDSDFSRTTRLVNEQYRGIHLLYVSLDAGKVWRGTMPAGNVTLIRSVLTADAATNAQEWAGCWLNVSLEAPPIDGSTNAVVLHAWRSTIESATVVGNELILRTQYRDEKASFWTALPQVKTVHYDIISQPHLQPELLRTIAELDRYIEDRRQYKVGSVLSPADYVATTRFMVRPNEPGSRRMPADAIEAKLMFDYYRIVRGPEQLRQMVDTNYARSLLAVFLKEANFVDTAKLMRDIRAYERERLAPKGIKLGFAGDTAVSQSLIQSIVTTQLQSLLGSLLGILAVTSLLGRSLRWGIYCVVPSALAVLINFAVMGWFGIPLGVATSMFAGMTLGIGVDFAIHLLEGFGFARARGLSPEAALRESMARTGPAVLINTLAVSLGFGVLAISQVPANARLGELTILGLVDCLVASLALLPVLLIWWPLKTAPTRNSDTNQTPSMTGN